MSANDPMDDRAYYERRLADETARAAAATIPEIASAHQTMAASYAARLRGDGKGADAGDS